MQLKIGAQKPPKMALKITHKKIKAIRNIRGDSPKGKIQSKRTDHTYESRFIFFKVGENK